MNNSKCNKCRLVNPADDLVCRRCGGMLGMPVYKSPTEEKTKLPKYLFLAPVLLLALGSGYMYSRTKGALDSIQPAQERHEPTMEKKLNPENPPVAVKPRDFYDQLPPERREAARQASQRDFRPIPVQGLSKETMKAQEDWKKMEERYQEGVLMRERSLPPR